MTLSRRLLRISLLLVLPLAALSAPAMADSITIAYTSSQNQNQTALVGGTGFTIVTFFGSITNNSIAPITFDTVGSGPVTPDPYVCLLYTSPSPRDLSTSRMPSSA